jgi:hypothetical protein
VTFDLDAGFSRSGCTYFGICFLCQQTARDIKKRVNRWHVKIRDTTKRHARSLGIPVHELIHCYGWHPDRMEHDARLAYENDCLYCRKSFLYMGHGPNDITLDIHDPTTPPYYSTNVRWICHTCNQQKSRTPPALWARRRIYYDKWQAHQDAGGARAWALRQPRFEFMMA